MFTQFWLGKLPQSGYFKDLEDKWIILDCLMEVGHMNVKWIELAQDHAHEEQH
jgi:hypothetical protein